MQTQQYVRTFLQRNNLLTIVVQISIVAVLGLLFLLGATLSMNVGGVYAQSVSACSQSDQAYTVIGGDTLSGIANRYQANWKQLATYNHIANPDLIYVNQRICILAKKLVGKESAPVKRFYSSILASTKVGSGNPFPYPQCTWWADERYHQVHVVYVPWTTNANAWQWTARAYEFGWQVSSRPTVGSIIDLQPWVQGAYGYGHVGVVERILSNGHVIASSMNWGSDPYAVSYTEFTPGAGVTFIRQ